MRKHVEAGSALYSDALLSYEGLATDFAHQVVDHAVTYVDGQVHTKWPREFLESTEALNQWNLRQR